ncbi:MAG: FecR family protein [Microcoleaceae cyanobacterium]
MTSRTVKVFKLAWAATRMSLGLITILGITSIPGFTQELSSPVVPLETGQLETGQLETQSSATRSLTVETLEGVVLRNEQVVKVGDRLKSGDQIKTGIRSKVSLRIDSNIGLVELSEQTTIQVKTLSGQAGTNLDQVTVLSMSQGQIRCSVGRFVSAPFWSQTLPQNQRQKSIKNSHFRIETLAGIIGVKGTTFGVSVAPDNRVAIHTLEGQVGVVAAGQEVSVEKGQFAILRPQEKPVIIPSTPRLSDLDTDTLNSNLENFRVVRLTPRTVQLQGRVAPTDLVYVENQAVSADAVGYFKYIGQLPASRRLAVTVRGPSVGERSYVITVP